MNKIFNINLGGYPFTIDDDAYRHLNQYLDAIRRHFSTSEGCDEIISDIEARMAELFTENVKGQSIVTSKDIDDVIKIMGTPEDFGAESIDDMDDAPSSKTKKYKTGKRLFRNKEDQVLGGVCSGIASYFGITDPLWIRLAFVLITISGGVGVLAYVILWIILPEAKTAGDKLQMRGEAINVSNIAKTVEKELEDLSERISELGNEFKSKKKSFKGSSFVLAPRTILAKGFSLLGKGIKGIFKLIRAVFRPFFFLILGILIFALGISWISLLFGLFSAAPYAGYFISGFSILGFVGLINGFVVLGVPLLGLILLAVRFMTSYRIDRSWLRTAWTVWGINLICMILLIVNTVNMNSARHNWSEDVSLELDVDNPVIINVEERPFDITFGSFGDLKYHNGKLYSEDVEIEIIQGENDEFRLIKEVRSRGKNVDVAEKWAKKVIHDPQVSNNTITLPAYYELQKGSKFRFQRVRYKLMVPQHAKLKFGKRAYWYVDHLDKDKNFESPRNFTEHEWIMGENGLVAAEYVASLRYEKVLDNKNFDKLNLKGKINITITKGENFKAKLIGKENLVESVEIVQQNEMLSIETQKRDYHSSVRLLIEMPKLTSLHTSNTQDVRIEGFDQEEMEIQHNGSHDIKAYINVQKLNLLLDGESNVEFNGTGDELNLQIYNYAKFKGENYIVNKAKLKANRYSLAAIHARDSLEYDVDHDYRLKIYGDPEKKRIRPANQ